MQQTVQLFFALGLIFSSIAAWSWVVLRWQRGSQLLPQETSREVPWDFLDVLFVLMIYFAVQAAIYFVVVPKTQEASPETSATDNSTVEIGIVADQGIDQAAFLDDGSQHPVVQLLGKDSSIEVIVLVFLVAAVSAPLWEEFFFRLILLAWMVKSEQQVAERTTRQWPLRAVPLLFTSLLFALLHLRHSNEPIETDVLIRGIALVGFVNIASLAISVLYLRIRHRATAADFGFAKAHFVRDLKITAIAFFMIVIPLLFLQAALKAFLPSDAAPDPIPLFFLALVLGFMYLRTTRITSCVLLHVAINTFSLLSALAVIRYGGANVP